MSDLSFYLTRKQSNQTSDEWDEKGQGSAGIFLKSPNFNNIAFGGGHC
jgi:hypothetical protein